MRPSWLNLDLGSNTRIFWTWWSGELKQIIPRWLWQTDEVSGAWVLLGLSNTKVEFKRWSNGTLQQLGSLDLNANAAAGMAALFKAHLARVLEPGDRIAVGLGPALYLHKEVTLPLAAAANLHQVMGFEMDRHTPFKADRVYYHACEIRRDTSRNTVTAALYAIPKKTLDTILDDLRSWQIIPQAAFVYASNMALDDSFNLLPSAASTTGNARLRDRLRKHLRGFRLFMLLLMSGLIVTALAIPLLQKRLAVIELTAAVASAEADAAQAHALRRELEKLTAEYNFVVNKKKSTVPVIVLLDEVSRLLPDDTWVQQLDLRSDELQIRGETASSSKLIVLVEDASLFRDANFLAPLTKGKSGKETYHIGVTVEAQATSDLVFAAQVLRQ